MSDVAIRVENLSKQYRIGQREPYKTLRDTLAEAFMAPLHAFRSNGRTASEMIWALRDVSFEVKHGEAVGIIGRNGAGKSTLLKILSRITEPTTGRAVIHGRVGSLLEVGTGFNPELTGRENIYLNGAILGMKRREIERKFDEIVAFAELEKFIDTPVKRYSSGMYMRLAFSVAAHLEPEILVVDEVLAVGDVEFQKKCLGKMGNVAEEGRTVLFVSHNMPAITALCSRAILLKQGAVAADGYSHDVVGEYLVGGRETMAEKVWPATDMPGNEIVRLRAARVVTEEGEAREAFDIRRPIGVEIEYEVLQAGHVLVPNVHFYTEAGVLAFVAGDQDPDWKRHPRAIGCFVSTVWVPGNFLSEGQMFVDVAVTTVKPKRVHFHERSALAFHVVDSLAGDTARGDFTGHYPGVVRPLLKWTTRCYQNNDKETA
ncbi:MAG: ABC transporter ATP-binding protein [Chloroflexi bacterium]|nr:ABC transporter ATP-binding protein [Chloroflexota bacterium]